MSESKEFARNKHFLRITDARQLTTVEELKQAVKNLDEVINRAKHFDGVTAPRWVLVRKITVYEKLVSLLSKPKKTGYYFRTKKY